MTVLFLLFAKTVISQIPRPTLSGFAAHLLLKFTFVVYLYCWYLGCNRDLSAQNDVLREAPKPARNEIAVALVVFAGFAFLVYAERLKQISVVFISFLAINVGAWLFLRRLLRACVDRARKRYREDGDVVHEVKTLILRDYLFGTWQWWRFATGFVLLTVLLGVSFEVVAVRGLGQDVTFACLTACTVLVLEGWIWYRRFRLKLQWDGLDWLSERGFVLAPKKNKTHHPEV